MMTHFKITRKSQILSAVLVLLALFGWGAQASAAPMQILPVEIIEQSARDYLNNELPWGPNDAEVSIHFNGKDMKLPEGKLDLEYQLMGKRNQVGRISLNLTVRVDNRIQRKIWLSGQVNAFYEVIQTRRPIKANHVFTEHDIEMVRIKSSRPLRDVVVDPEEIVGFKTIRSLDSGEMLSPHMLKRAPVLKRGDRIILVAEKGQLKITAPGKAKENGFKDAIVQVENVQTKKTVYGLVLDSHTVKVGF